MGAFERGDDPEFNVLNNLDLKYGDYIVFSDGRNIGQLYRTKINGTVRNTREDYSDGAQDGESFMHAKFRITEEGLKAEYSSPVPVEEDETVFEFSGISGSVPLRIIFNYQNNTMRVSGNQSSQFEYNLPDHPNYDRQVLKISWYRANDELVAECTFTGTDKGPGDAVGAFDNRTFQDGDYFRIESPVSQKIMISGNLTVDENDEGYKDEDFSVGIKDSNNLNQSKFFLDKAGSGTMDVIRMGRATISGVDDTTVLQGENFNKRLDVRATNYDNTDLTNSISVTGEVDTDEIGVYELIYSVTNSEGITTTVNRNVIVYSQASLSLKDMTPAPLEQGSINSTTESIHEYLLTLVIANDNDDGNITEDIEVTETNLNPEKVGEYNVTYSVENSFGKVSTLEHKVIVTRTISVSVPVQLPFQVVTNLKDKEANPFVTGVLKLKNNKTSDVKVYVESFTKQEGSGNLDIVEPGSVDNWETLSGDESITKMALGIFAKSGIENSDLSRSNPLWLTNDMTTKTMVGVLPRSESLTTYKEGSMSFVSRQGKNFIGGRSKGKFNLVLRFE